MSRPATAPDTRPHRREPHGGLVHRWDGVTTGPSAGTAARNLGLRVLAPAVALFAVLLGIGFLIVGPLGDLKAENGVSRALADGRTSRWNGITAVWSHVGNTEIVIGVCVVVALLVWWRTKQWWFALVPVIAISVQASVFVATTAIVGRERPTVERLDPAPPTSSYPSGHVGASTALYLAFALMAQRIETPWLRRLVTVVCVVVPFLVAYARVYRGMHHLSDVVIGAVNGIVCALLAWAWLRRDRTR